MQPTAEAEPMHILDEFVCRAIMAPPYDRLQPSSADSSNTPDADKPPATAEASSQDARPA